MSKRFTETDKWEDNWFRKLSPPEKLVFLYLVDKCDLAGFIEYDPEMIGFVTGLQTDEVVGAIQGLSRGCIEANGWLWIRNFLKHQKNENLNPENNAHKHIIKRIEEQQERFAGIQEFQEFLGAYQGLFSPIGKGKGKSRGNDLSNTDQYIEYKKAYEQVIGQTHPTLRPKQRQKLVELESDYGQAEVLALWRYFLKHRHEFIENGTGSPTIDWFYAKIQDVQLHKEPVDSYPQYDVNTMVP